MNGTDVTTATYQITDGGITDVDGVADGVINDPAGPAVAVIAESLSDTGDGTSWIVVAGATIGATALLLTIRRRSLQEIVEEDL